MDYMEETNLSKVEFQDSKSVKRTGLIFKAGDYPDKGFAISPEELIDAVDSFKPVPLDYEHLDGPLAGKFGKLEKVWVGDDGWSLYGTATIPQWLDENLEDNRKVSCTWDKGSKTLKKLALVRNPRVSDAALMAAFAADVLDNGKNEAGINDLINWMSSEKASFAKINTDKTWDGTWTIQSIHDMCAKSGAVCQPPSDNKEFVSKKESKTIQGLHDMACECGAKCQFMSDSNGGYPMFSNQEQEDGFFTKLGKYISTFLEAKSKTEVNEDATVEEAKHSDTEGETKMNEDKQKYEELVSQVSALKAELETIKAEAAKLSENNTTKADDKSTEFAAADPEKETLKRETEALQSQVDALKKEKLEVEASSFADSLISSNKALPNIRTGLVAAFKQLSEDDAKSQSAIEFSENGKNVSKSRVDVLKSLFSEPIHNLTTEEVISKADSVLDFSSEANNAELQKATDLAKEFASKNKKNSK